MNTAICTDGMMIYDDQHHNLCDVMFKVLNCHLLWVMNFNSNVLSMLVTDKSILQHYWDKKYYLNDPNLNFSNSQDKSPWRITLGTDSETLEKQGFLYDLYKLFNIEDFVSIERRKGSERYCFRFFTQANRFVLVNKLVNDLSIIKIFINTMAEKLKVDLHRQQGIDIAALR